MLKKTTSAASTVASYFQKSIWDKYDVPELLSHVTSAASHRM